MLFRSQTINTDQVNNAIRKYLDPAKAVRVAAGSLNEPSDATPAPVTNKQTISVRLDTPDAGWAITIDQIYNTGESLVVISSLKNEAETAAQVITTVSDTVKIPNTEPPLPIRHYILGKTWNWGASPDYTFIESMDTFGTALDGVKVVYQK